MSVSRKYPGQRPNSPKRKEFPVDKIAIAVSVLAVTCSFGSLLLDRLTYQKAEQAYQQAHCPVAILRFNRIIKAWRIVDMGNHIDIAQRHRSECIRYQAALDLEAAGEISAAIVAYNNFIIRYGTRIGNPLVKAARDRVKSLFKFSNPKALGNQELCGNLSAVEENALIPEDPSWAPLYLSCARMLANQEPLKANPIYENFVKKYPDSPLVSEAKAEWARSMLATTEEAEKLPPVRRVGLASNKLSILEIRNEGPLPMRLFLSGSEDRVEEIERCPSCVKQFAKVPDICPEKGPVERYELKPGSYRVLTQRVSGEYVIPYKGIWELKAGTIYSTCFFIVNSPFYQQHE